MQSLLLGNYNAFSQDNNNFVLNVFAVSRHFISSPLLIVRCLRLLIDRAGSEEGVGRYISVVQLIQYCEMMGLEEAAVRASLRILLEYRLVEPYDPSVEDIDAVDRVAITHSGRMHYEMATNDKEYLTLMALATPLRTESDVDQLRVLKKHLASRDTSDEI